MKRTLYIFQDGELRRKDNSLYFESDERRKFIPVENTNDIYIFGEVDVSKRFLEFAAQKQICVHYFNRYGYYVGTFYPREHYNAGHVIVKQAELYLDQAQRLPLARKFVAGSIGQMRVVLKYYRSRVRKGNERLSEIVEKLTDDAKRSGMADTIEELMAVEGHARERYYQAFDPIMDDPDFIFEKRTKRPRKIV